MVHKYYPELATLGGAPETIKLKIADAAIHCWEMIDEMVMVNLVESMPHRIKAVIKAKGWYTKY